MIYKELQTGPDEVEVTNICCLEQELVSKELFENQPSDFVDNKNKSPRGREIYLINRSKPQKHSYWSSTISYLFLGRLFHILKEHFNKLFVFYENFVTIYR